jgi:uncharacterized membrane protein YdbT with pleckstrin-like domain
VGYMEKNLVQGETVLYKTGLHWIVLIVPLIVSLVLGVFGLAFVIGGYEASGERGSYPGMIIVGLLVLIGASVLIGAGFIRQLSTEVVLSNKRVLIKSGLINRKSIEVVLQKVESIGVDESALGRLLGTEVSSSVERAERSKSLARLRIRTSLGGRSSNK